MSSLCANNKGAIQCNNKNNLCNASNSINVANKSKKMNRSSILVRAKVTIILTMAIMMTINHNEPTNHVASAFTLPKQCQHSLSPPTSFLLLSPPSSSTTTTTTLFQARGGIHGKKSRMIASTKKKKKSNNSPYNSKTKKKGKNKSKKGTSSSSKENDIARASTKSNVALPSSKSNAPPWKIMSAKDAKQNIQNEIQRRESIAKGEISSSDVISTTTTTTTVSKADASKSNRLLSDADRSLVSWRRFNPETTPSGVAFIGSYLGTKTPPSLGVPEVAFLGRSNVGKSSLLNKLSDMATKKGGGGKSNNSDRARVGKTPGATASVNLYALLGKQNRNSGEAKPILGFADLPGFGYAKLGKELKADVEVAAERYLGKRRELALGVLLVDVRRIPSEDDRAVLAALYDLGVPLVAVATKVDKMGSNREEVERSLEVVRDGLGLPDGQPLAVSSVTGVGVRELWRIVLDACEERVEELCEEVGGGDSSEEDDDEDDEDEFFEDGEELQYDQGYDWVHDSGRLRESADMYSDEEEDYGWDDDEDYDDGKMSNQERQAAEKEFFKLKSLKKAARDMERRGEV